MHLEHPPLLWHNPSFPDVTRAVEQLGLPQKRVAYEKLRRRREKMARLGPFWPFLQKYAACIFFLVVVPGVWVTTHNLGLGITIVAIGATLTIGVEVYFTLRGQWLERMLYQGTTAIRNAYKVGTLLSNELAWVTLDNELQKFDVDMLTILNSELLFEATAGDVQGFLDETNQHFRDLALEGQLPPDVISYSQRAVARIASAYAASICLTIARFKRQRLGGSA